MDNRTLLSICRAAREEQAKPDNVSPGMCFTYFRMCYAASFVGPPFEQLYVQATRRPWVLRGVPSDVASGRDVYANYLKELPIPNTTEGREARVRVWDQVIAFVETWVLSEEVLREVIAEEQAP